MTLRIPDTIADLFGPNNEAGLAAATNATDEIWIPAGPGSYDRYKWKATGIGGVGWRDFSSTTADQADTPVFLSDRFYDKYGGLGGNGWRSTASPAADRAGEPLSSGYQVQRKFSSAINVLLKPPPLAVAHDFDLKIEHDGGNVYLAWDAVPGRFYEIVTSTDAVSWTPAHRSTAQVTNIGCRFIPTREPPPRLPRTFENLSSLWRRRPLAQ